MPRVDYNPDREGHVAKKWEVVKATTRDLTVEVDGQSMPFGKDGAFRVSDEGVAQVIREEYAKRGDVTVTRIRYPDAHDRGHNYFFTVPELPWKRSKDNGSEEESQENAEGHAHDERQDDVGRRDEADDGEKETKVPSEARGGAQEN